MDAYRAIGKYTKKTMKLSLHLLLNMRFLVKKQITQILTKYNFKFHTFRFLINGGS